MIRIIVAGGSSNRRRGNLWDMSCKSVSTFDTPNGNLPVVPEPIHMCFFVLLGANPYLFWLQWACCKVLGGPKYRHWPRCLQILRVGPGRALDQTLCRIVGLHPDSTVSWRKTVFVNTLPKASLFYSVICEKCWLSKLLTVNQQIMGYH